MALSFDANYYLNARPDVFHAFVATAGATGKTWAEFAEEHYNTFGRFEGANPNATFNTDEYLAANPDVAAAGVNPFTHYLHFGAAEGRAPSDSFPSFASFDSAAYLAANPDLGAAGIDTAEEAYAHFVIFGQFEDRPGAPAVDNGLPGTTYTLTPGADNFPGTKGNDTFNALTVNASGAAADTLTAFDKLDGGAGVDTLNIYSDSVASKNMTLPATASIKNIEIININNAGAAFTTSGGVVEASKFEGATQIWQAGSAAGVTALGASTVAGFRDITTNVSVAPAAGVASASVALEAFREGANIQFDGSAATSTLDSVTVKGTVKDTNADGVVAAIGLDVRLGKDVQTLTVNTEAGATVTTIKNGASAKDLTTVDASGSKGAVTYSAAATVSTIKGGSGNDVLTIATATAKDNPATPADETVSALVQAGAGNDKITVNTTGTGTTTVEAGDGNDSVTLTGRGSGKLTVDLGAGDDTFDGAGVVNGTDVIDGGEGVDTLLLNMVGAANIGAFKNFEVFDAKGLNKTLDVDILASNNTVTEFIASGDTGGAAVLTNIGAGVGFRVTGDTTIGNVTTLTQKVAGDLTITLDIDETGATAATTASTARDAAVTATNATSVKAVFDSAFVGEATGAGDNTTNLKITGNAATTLEIVSGGANAFNDIDYTTGSVSGKSALTGVTVSGDRALNLDLAISGGGSNEVSTVNASALTGALTFALDDLKAAGTLTLGSGADMIIAQTGAALAGVEAAARYISGFQKGTAEDATAQGEFDVINLTGAVQAADVAATATHTVKDGKFIFNGAGPATLADALSLISGVITANEAVVFEYIGNSYIYAEGATDGGTDDVLVQLTGMTGLAGLDTVGAANDLYVF